MFIHMDDAQIFSVAFGSPTAPAIVGIGGWIGNWELWALPFSKLSAKFYTVAYDHRGSGATTAPLASIVLDKLVDDVLAVMDAYHIERCYLAAESAGAATALSAALKHPQRIAGLIIVDGHYFSDTPNTRDPFLAGLKTRYSATLDMFVEACIPEQNCDHLKRWGRQILERAAPEAAIALYCAANPIDLRDELARITQPTLILHGEADRIVPVESARWLARTLPTAELIILPGAGHVPTMTRPDDVVREITRFLGTA